MIADLHGDDDPDDSILLAKAATVLVYCICKV